MRREGTERSGIVFHIVMPCRTRLRCSPGRTSEGPLSVVREVSPSRQGPPLSLTLLRNTFGALFAVHRYLLLGALDSHKAILETPQLREGDSTEGSEGKAYLYRRYKPPRRAQTRNARLTGALCASPSNTRPVVQRLILGGRMFRTASFRNLYSTAAQGLVAAGSGIWIYV